MYLSLFRDVPLVDCWKLCRENKVQIWRIHPDNEDISEGQNIRENCDILFAKQIQTLVESICCVF